MADVTKTRLFLVLSLVYISLTKGRSMFTTFQRQFAMPTILVSSLICFLVSFLPVVPFISRSPQPVLSSHANSYGIARDKAVARKRMLLRAKETREKERQLSALRATVQSHEEAMRHTSFMALQDRILLWNQIWKLEKELKALRSNTSGRKRQVVVEGGVTSRSTSSLSTSRVITGRSSDGSRVSWRAMLSLAVNPSASRSNLDLTESVDDIVDEIAQALQSGRSCANAPKKEELDSIMEESFVSSASSASSDSDSDSDEASDHTIVDSPTLVHAKLPLTPPAICIDDHKVFSPTHTSPDAPVSIYDWMASQDRTRESEDVGKAVIFEPTPGVPRFSSLSDIFTNHSI